MQVSRRAVTYSSVVVVMAVVLSVALLQLTQTTAQSAPLAAESVPFRIYKIPSGDPPTTDWEFQIVSESSPPSVEYLTPVGMWNFSFR